MVMFYLKIHVHRTPTCTPSSFQTEHHSVCKSRYIMSFVWKEWPWWLSHHYSLEFSRKPVYLNPGMDGLQTSTFIKVGKSWMKEDFEFWPYFCAILLLLVPLFNGGVTQMHQWPIQLISSKILLKTKNLCLWFNSALRASQGRWWRSR